MEISTIGWCVIGVIIVGSVLLEIYLSYRKSMWPGLMIPFFCLIYSIASACGIQSIDHHVTVSNKSYDESGVVVEEIEEQPSGTATKENPVSFMAKAIPVFIVSSVPNLFYLVIYFACREKRRQKAQIAEHEG